MLNWIVWNRTDYLIQNGFGIKQPTNDFAIKHNQPKQPTNQPYIYVFFSEKKTVTTRVMQSSSNELNTSVADSVKCKQTKVDTYALKSLTNRWVWHKPFLKVGPNVGP